jgi:hypothetical protein
VRSTARLTAGAEQALLGLRVAALEAGAGGMSRHRAALVRYGKRPMAPDEVRFAADRYGLVILQPWEILALRALKLQRPDVVVLCYKCLSSTRSNEPSGQPSAAGMTFDEAQAAGETWFAHRAGTGERVEWDGFTEHWQMAVWNEDYRRRWVENVTEAVSGELWDGVFADNDVFDDYYKLGSLAEVKDMAEIRAALGVLVDDAGEQLNAAGKLLIPNIAESRREPERWARHARYGGGFEEHWLGWRPDAHFDELTCEQQASELHGPGIGIVRVNVGPVKEPGFLYAVAAFWVLGAGLGWACTATEPDDYEGLPYRSEQSWDLGSPLGSPLARDGGRARQFTSGWAAVNLGDTGPVSFEVPAGLVDGNGRQAPAIVTLAPREGCIYTTAAVRDRARRRPPRGPLLAMNIRPTDTDPEWFELRGEARLENNVLRIPLRHDYADGVSSPSFAGLGWTTRTRLDIPVREPSSEILLQLRADNGEFVSIGKSGSALLMRVQLLDERSDETLTFDPDRHHWWGIQLDTKGIRWMTSADGVAWDVQRELIDSGFPRRRVIVDLVGGHIEQDGAEEEAGIGVLEVVPNRDETATPAQPRPRLAAGLT